MGFFSRLSSIFSGAKGMSRGSSVAFVALLIIMVGALIWYLERSWTLLIYYAIAVVVLLLLWWLVAFLANRASARRADAMDRELVNSEGVAKLRQNWVEATRRLKEFDINRDKLPFYVLIGEPQSGKSTTLRKSGMQFPLGMEAVSGLGGTLNCDWWFTDKAVLLDTAGRLSFHQAEQDSREWQLFLRLVARFRPELPINGVITIIPATSLLQDTPQQQEEKANVLRRAFLEIQRVLQIQFPVYVLITKCDQIYGYSDFFGALDQVETAQLLGWSREPARLGAPYDGEEVRQALDMMVARMRMWRLKLLESPSLEAGQRAGKYDVDRLFAFPTELASLRAPLQRYLDVMFPQSHLLDPLFLRGFYFTSGLRQTPQFVSYLQNLGMPAGAMDGMAASFLEDEQAFFIRHFYDKKCFPEQGLVEPTRARKRKARQTALLGYIGAGILAVLGLFFSWRHMNKISREVGEPREYLLYLQDNYDKEATREDDADDLEQLVGLAGSGEGNLPKGVVRKLQDRELLSGQFGSEAKELSRALVYATRGFYYKHVAGPYFREEFLGGFRRSELQDYYRKEVKWLDEAAIRKKLAALQQLKELASSPEQAYESWEKAAEAGPTIRGKKHDLPLGELDALVEELFERRNDEEPENPERAGANDWRLYAYLLGGELSESDAAGLNRTAEHLQQTYLWRLGRGEECPKLEAPRDDAERARASLTFYLQAVAASRGLQKALEQQEELVQKRKELLGYKQPYRDHQGWGDHLEKVEAALEVARERRQAWESFMERWRGTEFLGLEAALQEFEERHDREFLAVLYRGGDTAAAWQEDVEDALRACEKRVRDAGLELFWQGVEKEGGRLSYATATDLFAAMESNADWARVAKELFKAGERPRQLTSTKDLESLGSRLQQALRVDGVVREEEEILTVGRAIFYLRARRDFRLPGQKLEDRPVNHPLADWPTEDGSRPRFGSKSYPIWYEDPPAPGARQVEVELPRLPKWLAPILEEGTESLVKLWQETRRGSYREAREQAQSFWLERFPTDMLDGLVQYRQPGDWPAFLEELKWLVGPGAFENYYTTWARGLGACGFEEVARATENVIKVREALADLKDATNKCQGLHQTAFGEGRLARITPEIEQKIRVEGEKLLQLLENFQQADEALRRKDGEAWRRISRVPVVRELRYAADRWDPEPKWRTYVGQLGLQRNLGDIARRREAWNRWVETAIPRGFPLVRSPRDAPVREVSVFLNREWPRQRESMVRFEKEYEKLRREALQGGRRLPLSPVPDSVRRAREYYDTLSDFLGLKERPTLAGPTKVRLSAIDVGQLTSALVYVKAGSGKELSFGRSDPQEQQSVLINWSWGQAGILQITGGMPFTGTRRSRFETPSSPWALLRFVSGGPGDVASAAPTVAITMRGPQATESLTFRVEVAGQAPSTLWPGSPPSISAMVWPE